VDADRRQGAPGARADGQPLVAGLAAGHTARADHLGDAARAPALPHRLRLPRPPAPRRDRRRRHARAGAGAAFGGRLPRGADGYAARDGSRSAHLADAGRGEGSHPLRRGPRARDVRPGVGRSASGARSRRWTACCDDHLSGRRAPRHPGGIPHLADRVVRESYSHEVASVGWWPGSGAVLEPSFFAYAYRSPRVTARRPSSQGPLPTARR
jgi:hypothetical protein